MKITNKLFAALVLFGISNAAFGYDFTIKNMTKKPIWVIVQVKDDGKKQAFPQPFVRNAVIQPLTSEVFSFGNYCLESVSVDEEQLPMVYMPSNKGEDENSALCQSHNGIILSTNPTANDTAKHVYVYTCE